MHLATQSVAIQAALAQMDLPIALTELATTIALSLVLIHMEIITLDLAIELAHTPPAHLIDDGFDNHFWAACRSPHGPSISSVLFQFPRF